MANPKVVAGKKIFIEVEIRDSQDRIVNNSGTTWSSSAPTIATIGAQTDKGVFVTGVAAGTTTITATNGADSASIDIDVIAAPAAQARKIFLRPTPQS